MVKRNPTDLDAWLKYLNLNKHNKELIVSIIEKALTHLPSSSFLTSLYLHYSPESDYLSMYKKLACIDDDLVDDLVLKLLLRRGDLTITEQRDLLADLVRVVKL